VNPQPTQANVGQATARHAAGTALAGIGQGWLELERVMGIEYIADVRLFSANHTVVGIVACWRDLRAKNTGIPANASQCGHCLGAPATAGGRLGSVGLASI
jgi:hypothetical protein